MHGVRGVLGRVEQLEPRHKDQHLGGRFRAGRHLELELDAIDRACLAGFFHGVVWLDQAEITARCGFAQPGIDLSARAGRQHGAVLIQRAASHGVAGKDVLGHGFLKEAGRGDHLDFAAPDIGFVDHALHAAVVIRVAMGVDHGDHRLLRPMLEIEIQCGAGGFPGHQHVDQDDARIAFHNSHVRQIESAHLIHAVRHLEEVVEHVQLCDAPQAWVDGVRRLALQELVLVQVPARAAVVRRESTARDGPHETAMGVVEVGFIGEGKLLIDRQVVLPGDCGGVLGGREGRLLG